MSKEFRLEILRGNDAGAQFRITGARVLFGRSSSCDIVVTDPSVSRNHAELIKLNDSYMLKDLGSSNGVFVNGQRVMEKVLVHSDVFNIGNHSYKIYEIAASEQKRVLAASNRDSTQIGAKTSSAMPAPASVSVPNFGGGTNKKRLYMYGGVGAILVIVLLLSSTDDNKTETKKDGKKTEEARNDKTPADLMLEENPEYQRKIQEGMEDFYNKANEFYFEGRREYRVKNYVRALEQFRRALTFYPRHAPAMEYARLSSEHIKKDSRNFLLIGKKLLAQQKYREAIKLFNDAMDLNSSNQNGDVFKESEKMKNIAEKRLQESMR